MAQICEMIAGALRSSSCGPVDHLHHTPAQCIQLDDTRARLTHATSFIVPISDLSIAFVKEVGIGWTSGKVLSVPNREILEVSPVSWDNTGDFENSVS